MPHGVLFRGGKEKDIRQELVNDNLIEAIISLPPALFYNTGIPACILVINKSKPDSLRDNILFINADREFAVGKAQNKLRPEDIEKIDFVFSNKIELPKYSRLVSRDEIIEHDYNLNIRRYVDNTPEPEPEDVKAHLLGGIPKVEVESNVKIFDKFGFDPALIFDSQSGSYAAFQSSITDKQSIRPIVDADENTQAVFKRMHDEMADWWQLAQADFAKLVNNNIYAQVRHELLTSIKDSFLPIGVLDQFQTAGVFVNWWQTIRYDLKTIVNSGWNQTLIPDEYMIAKFFRAETVAISETESLMSEAEANLTEAIEAVEYEAEEDEKVTASKIKSYLKDEIESLQGEEDETKEADIAAVKKQLKTVTVFEKEVKDLKATLKRQRYELERKLQFKREGIDEERAALAIAIENKRREITRLRDAPAINAKAEKAREKAINSLEEDTARYSKTLAGLEGELDAIGGVITAEEARELILQKLHDLINNELLRYLNAEKRALLATFEKMWDKYAVSARTIESEREATMRELNDYLTKLGYLIDEFAVAQS